MTTTPRVRAASACFGALNNKSSTPTFLRAQERKQGVRIRGVVVLKVSSTGHFNFYIEDHALQVYIIKGSMVLGKGSSKCG